MLLNQKNMSQVQLWKITRGSQQILKNILKIKTLILRCIVLSKRLCNKMTLSSIKITIVKSIYQCKSIAFILRLKPNPCQISSYDTGVSSVYSQWGTLPSNIVWVVCMADSQSGVEPLWRLYGLTLTNKLKHNIQSFTNLNIFNYYIQNFLIFVLENRKCTKYWSSILTTNLCVIEFFHLFWSSDRSHILAARSIQMLAPCDS